jgi:hypothetical protein
LLVFEVVLVVCCCVCAACAAAIIIARTNRLPIDWKRFSLSARNAFRIYVSNKYRSYASGIFLETQKAVSHDSFTPKEYKSSLSRSCCCRGKSCSSLFHVRWRDHLWGNVESEFSSKKKKEFVVCSVVRCFCRCLTKNGGEV